MTLNQILKSDIFLFLFLSITALVGWIYTYMDKNLGTKYSALSIGFVDAVVVILTIFIGSMFLDREKIRQVINDLRRMTLYEYSQLIIIGVLGTMLGLIGTMIVQHHNIGKIQIHDYIATIFVSAIGIYVFMNNELNTRKVIGMLLIALGGYLFGNNQI